MPEVTHRRLSLAVVLATAVLAGCGGDGDEETSSPAPTPSTEAVPPTTTTTQEEEPTQPRRKTLADCLRAAPGVESVLEKGADSEDARYFEEFVGKRPRILALTVEGQSTEIDAFVFDSAAAARKAAPGAGGAGLEATVHGSSVLVAPAGADTKAIAGCLEAA